MKFTLVPGAEIDALTPEEFGDILAELAGGGRVRPEEVVRAEANGKTDGSGAITLPVYTVPVGMQAVITRLYVADDGHSFGSPYTPAAGNYFGLEVLRNDIVVEGFSAVGLAANTPGVLPWTMNQGRSQGIRLSNGDSLSIRFGQVGANPGANLGVTCRAQGWLEPLFDPDAGEGQRRRGPSTRDRG